MTIIYGLGNNETKYLDTKHNAGRYVLENWVNLLQLSFTKRDKYAFAKTELSGETTYFVYSLGFMNRSGEALESFLKFFKLSFQASDVLLVIQDDSDQTVGKRKLIQSGGSAGHHGINNIYKHLARWQLELTQIWRLKIGIRPPNNNGQSIHFVLSPISKPEELEWQLLAKIGADMTTSIATGDWVKVQQLFNTRESKPN